MRKCAPATTVGARLYKSKQKMDKYLWPEDLAEAFRVDKDTVIEWLKNGEIPGHKIGGVWRTDPDELAKDLRDE